MLRSHLNAIEAVLLAQSNTASNAGHPNLRGGPREWFVRDFLSNHLPANLQVGQGEIIDPSSVPGTDLNTYRPQIDIVLNRKDVPVITLSENDSIFLAEGVMATIEVKSRLKKYGKGSLEKACETTVKLKKLERNLSTSGMGGGSWPEHIVSYIVSFDGPAKIDTVAKWLPQIRNNLQCTPAEMPEMIVILGKGVVFRIDAWPTIKIIPSPQNKIWAFQQQKEQNLFSLFTHMLSWMGWITSPPDIGGYCKSLVFKNSFCI